MSWFDLGALVIVALAVFDGARNGLVWMALELVFLLTAALTARGLHVHLEPYLLKIADLGADDVASASHAVIFFTSLGFFMGLLFLVHPASKRWRFRHDAWFGGGLGLVNGLIASLLLFSIAVWSRPRSGLEETLAGSRLVPVLRSVHGHGFAAIFPERLHERLDQLERP